MQPAPPDTIAVDHFVTRYRPGAGGATAVPTLGDSLGVMARLPGVRDRVDGLGPGCRCLIQGCTAPGNADALRRFLGHPERPRIEVVAVDLLDLPSVYRRLGWTVPEAGFVRADARKLQHFFPRGHFDVVAQDFLLNCAPPAEAPDLLAAARHVLRPGGLLLISVTDSAGLGDHPAITPDGFARLAGTPWDCAARDLAGLLPDAERRARVLPRLAGRVVRACNDGAVTLVIAPHGRFEFFLPIARILRLLDNAGFDVVARATEWGRDDNGVDCRRWRFVACAAWPVRPDARGGLRPARRHAVR